MARTLILCALLLSLPLVGRADEPQPTETVIRLTVQPMAEPRPALRYQLLPELKEMEPGNPIQGYLKCFMEQTNFFHRQDVLEKREKWQTMPLKDLPLDEVRDYGGKLMQRVDQAARLDTLDWQVLVPLRRDGIRLLLPEVQELRNLASALKVRFRAQVAERRFDEALTTAKTMFALSRHLGQHPTLITDLVGMAVAFLAIGPLDEMLEQPGCPNLYWALAQLPSPLIDLRHGLQGERTFFEVELRLLDDRAAMSEGQLQAVVARLEELYELVQVKPPEGGARAWLDARAKDAAHVTAARKRLTDSGLDAARVKEFPALQVVLLDEKRSFEMHRDERMKWVTLPYWQAAAHFDARPAPREGNEELLYPLLGTQSYRKVRLAQMRLEQRLALLRHVEALRLYAAGHDGKLPTSLDDIGLPLPPDPATGKPFAYKLDGTTASIRNTPPRGEEKNAPFNVRYEVTIRK
jgi:hypothetical protein